MTFRRLLLLGVAVCMVSACANFKVGGHPYGLEEKIAGLQLGRTTRKDVLDAFGRPVHTVRGDGRETLYYPSFSEKQPNAPEFTITIEHGVVSAYSLRQ